jgi:hypothetical protein
MRLLAWNAGWIFAVGAAVPLHAQDRGFWSFLEPGRVLERCAESSAAHTQARASLDHLTRRIEQLDNAGSPSSAVDQLHALLRSECFLPAAETTRAPRPDTTRSLKHWWIDGGGRDWLASFLQLPRLGPADALTPHIVVPADARKTLSLDAHRDHPLQRFLCASSDTACGAVTKGWKLRADTYFDAHRALGRNDMPATDAERPASGVNVTSRECAAQAASSDNAQRYQAWRSCIESRRPRKAALPLGEFKAPADGWLVISGRRGHYDFCDTTRAYDLATGAAFISDSCSGLALKRDGQVDISATDGARAERVRAGTVSADNLREAAWMMMFRAETQEVQAEAEYYPLPAGLIPVARVRQEDDDPDSTGLTSNTGQTVLTWRWLPPAGPALVGELTWPGSYDAAEDHAVSLLDVAEQSLVEGCAPGRVPAPAMFSSRPGRNLDDVPARAIEELDRDFRKAFDKWKSLAACRPGRRSGLP